MPGAWGTMAEALCRCGVTAEVAGCGACPGLRAPYQAFLHIRPLLAVRWGPWLPHSADLGTEAPGAHWCPLTHGLCAERWALWATGPTTPPREAWEASELTKFLTAGPPAPTCLFPSLPWPARCPADALGKLSFFSPSASTHNTSGPGVNPGPLRELPSGHRLGSSSPSGPQRTGWTLELPLLACGVAAGVR